MLYRTTQELTAVQQRSQLASEAISKLKLQNGQLNARLAGVTDVATNNKLVGAIQANVAQIDLTNEAKQKIDEQVRAARAEVNKLRAAYVQEILDMREMADGISGAYKKLSDDPRSRVAIARLAEETEKKYTVARTFRTSLNKLSDFPQYESASSRSKMSSVPYWSRRHTG